MNLETASAPARPVGVGVVRALHRVAQSEQVTAAMVMTTFYFSAPAREFAEDLHYQISLNNYFHLRLWLDRYRPPTRSAFSFGLAFPGVSYHRLFAIF